MTILLLQNRKLKRFFSIFCLLVIGAVFYVTLILRTPKKQPKKETQSKVAEALALIPQIKVKAVSCAKLFNNDVQEQRKALNPTNYQNSTLTMKHFSYIECRLFVRARGYITSPLTSEEESFPIAYSMVVYKDIGQVERLLRAIYRPQNAYCIHVDKKSPKELHEGLKRLARCFPNVVTSSRTVDVKWGFWTNLESDLICMKDLLDKYPKWKYLINLTGQEFPLRTNLELVRILKAFNGSNDIEIMNKTTPAYFPTYRIPPRKLNFTVSWVKGHLQIAAVREFIEFMFVNKKARQILKVLRKAINPDETFFSTLNFNPTFGAPGAQIRNLTNDTDSSPTIIRLKNWNYTGQDYPCESGLWVRHLCIWGVKDLPFIDTRHELFINKLYWNFQPFALDCLEERIFSNTMRDYTVGTPLNISFYRNQLSVK